MANFNIAICMAALKFIQLLKEKIAADVDILRKTVLEM